MELSMYTLLSIAKAHHASDLHITVGVRPKCRISGTLYEMDGFEKLTPAMTKELVESMFGPKQKATMEATGEVDFAYTDTRVGRFRVNAFHQRGSYAAKQMELSMYTLLSIAKAHHASDLHITVGVRPKCRISGTLYEMDGFEKLTPAMTKELVESMFGPKQKATMEATGEVDFAYTDTRVGRFRVNAFHQRGSYAAVLRIVASDIPTPEALGIPEAVLGLTKKKRGLVLVTGPTGSGKSTTLASLIDVINKERNEHIITLEDPIEYLHKHNRSIVNQREIGLDTDSYGNALRAALREDPDIILVGEMRDFDTISTAITAAETGHLVFSTLHTIGAAPTIERIVDVFPPHQQNQIRSQLASVLEAVISQQLLPTIDGKSRVAAFEVMLGTPAIKNLIREDKAHQIPSIMQTSKKIGMQTMDDSLFSLYLKHKIDAANAVEYAQDTGNMQQKLF